MVLKINADPDLDPDDEGLILCRVKTKFVFLKEFFTNIFTSIENYRIFIQKVRVLYIEKSTKSML